MNGIMIGTNNTALGYGGYTIGPGTIHLGDHISTCSPYETVMEKKVKTLEEKVNHLETIITKQNEMLIALWYYPGMPGAIEAKERFENDLNKMESRK